MKTYSFLGSLFLFLSLSAATYAASCPPSPTLTELVSSSTHVFVAQVASATLSADRKWIDATFHVEEALKGDPVKVPSVRATFTETNFDLPQDVYMSGGDLLISPGMHFLVFASEDGPVLYGLCTRTQVLRKRDDVLLRSIRSFVLQR